MTYTVICYEITLEKCICVGRTIVSTLPHCDKNLMISCRHECLGKVIMVINSFFKMHRLDDCKVYL